MPFPAVENFTGTHCQSSRHPNQRADCEPWTAKLEAQIKRLGELVAQQAVA
jgi:hypothetical protein